MTESCFKFSPETLSCPRCVIIRELKITESGYSDITRPGQSCHFMLIQATLMICKNLPNQKCVKKPILLRHHFLQNHYVFRGRMDWDYSPNEQEKGNVYTFTAYQYIFSLLCL